VGGTLGEYVVVLCTASAQDAERISRALVEERLAACVSMASVSSCYRWEGKVSLEREEMMIIKTERNMTDRLMGRVLELHSYEVPEMIVLPILEGHRPYLEWVSQSLAKGGDFQSLE